MNPQSKRLGTGLMVMAALTASTVIGDEVPKTSSKTVDTASAAEPAIPRVSLETARDRAKVMHDVYSASLTVMHHRYFHGDRATVPARALEDVFRTIEEDSKIQARWISASFKPMSINHEPKTDFEKQAAQELAKGEESSEIIENGYYRRAGSIPMSGGCVHCHAGFFANQNANRKFSGLIISIPVTEGTRLPAEPSPPAAPH